jgi:hypothetical protein
MPPLSRLTAVLALALLTASYAQAQRVRVQPSATPHPSASTLAARATPNPAGLRPPVPAGLTSGSGAAVATNPVITDNANNPNVGTSVPGMTTVPTIIVGGGGTGTPTGVPGLQSAAAATAYMGAGGARGPSQYVGSGGSGYSAVDLARSFLYADADHDGELSASEARGLAIAPMTFEEMDRNFDGIISRFEYQDATR